MSLQNESKITNRIWIVIELRLQIGAVGSQKRFLTSKASPKNLTHCRVQRFPFRFLPFLHKAKTAYRLEYKVVCFFFKCLILMYS